jgi:N-acetylglucosaminyldiphosphoundecaprenol N-acetyl-beta-D-mannosaminyltransferase
VNHLSAVTPDERADVPRLDRRCRARSSGPHVNGVRIDSISRQHYLLSIESFLSCGYSHVVHFCAAHPTVEARRDLAFRAILNMGSMNVPDGMAVAWAARLFGLRTERLAGTEGMYLSARWGGPRMVRHYLFGSTRHTLERLRARLEEINPGILIVGAEAPPFGPVRDADIRESVGRIQDAGTQMLWVGLGAPKQELAAHRLQALHAAPVILCVGAAFDFVAGTKRRAPVWMQQAGLEWLHRLGSEPQRLWKRYAIGNARFVAGVISDKVFLERTRSGRVATLARK